MSGLTTHVLDLTHGIPASGVRVELYCFEELSSGWKLIKTDITNSDGRLDAPLLSEESIKIGTYELIFHVGDYFRSKGTVLPDPPFLDQVPVRFGLGSLDSHYHVPLLVSPWSYQVYRGS